MELLIISGLSGAGKSTGVKVLEDIGYFCIDNMPVSLVSTFVELSRQNPNISKIALVIDARGSGFFDSLGDTNEYLKSEKIDYKIVFFEASDDVLEHRFKETRRSHPLVKDGERTRDAIAKEREILMPLRRRADIVIDSTQYSASELRERVLQMFTGNIGNNMKVNVMSFGFKYGVPTDADLVVDVRCLPNPFYVDELRNMTGLDAEIVDFVMTKAETEKFVGLYKSFLEYAVPLNAKEGKSTLEIAVGCTGGKHRSVAIAEELSSFVIKLGYHSSCTHRDIRKA